MLIYKQDDYKDLSIDVPMAVANRFEDRLQVCQDKETTLQPHSSPSKPKNFGWSSAPITATETENQFEPNETGKDIRKGKAPQRQYPLDPSTDFELQARGSSRPKANKFVHWCIGTATTHVQNICVEATEGAKTGTAFIKELVTSYRKFRGVRWWFSLTDLANVKIIQVMSFLLERYDLLY
jgi:hypothetical protein